VKAYHVCALSYFFLCASGEKSSVSRKEAQRKFDMLRHAIESKKLIEKTNESPKGARILKPVASPQGIDSSLFIKALSGRNTLCRPFGAFADFSNSFLIPASGGTTFHAGHSPTSNRRNLLFHPDSSGATI
jgi:hypothetical protein